MSEHTMLALGILGWTLLLGGYFLVNRYAPQVLFWIGRVFQIDPNDF